MRLRSGIDAPEAPPAATFAPSLGRCARPTIGGRSTYTVLGFAGYGLAATVSGALAWALGLGLATRAVALSAPPVAFLVTVAIASARAGYERIVFYQAAIAGVATTFALGLALGRAGAMTDVATIGIGTFLVLGRLGCFHVGCCHGRPVRRLGVRYGAAHARLGFPARWVDRPVAPVQLIEAAASAGLTIAAIAIALAPGGRAGDAAACYASGYGVVRFALELWRGDGDRRYWRGLSEAQRLAVVTVGAALALAPSWRTAVGAGVVAAMAAAVVATARRPAIALGRPRHLDEIERVHRELAMQRGSQTTSEGLAISRMQLPDGRTDFVWSRPGLTPELAARLAAALFVAPEVVPGRQSGLFHVLVD